MTNEQIKKILLELPIIKEEDIFNAAIFYYMAGRFPNMKISKCTEIVDEIRTEILNKEFQRIWKEDSQT